MFTMIFRQLTDVDIYHTYADFVSHTIDDAQLTYSDVDEHTDGDVDHHC